MNIPYPSFQPTLTEPGLKHFGLILTSSSPCASLNGIVHSYLQINAEKPTPYPVMPDGTQAIFISPDGSMISGSQSQSYDIQIPQAGDYFGIRFYPGALRHLFKLNLAEITNQLVDEKYFPCDLFGTLHHKIYQHQRFYDRANVCEQWLLQHFNPQPATQFEQALSLIYQSQGNLKIAQLATRVGWSSRHLNRLFRLNTGLNTKTFSQIIRLQHVCQYLYRSPADSLTTAMELGFSDQPHLLNNFRQHLLTNPNRFFSRFMSDFYNR